MYSTQTSLSKFQPIGQLQSSSSPFTGGTKSHHEPTDNVTETPYPYTSQMILKRVRKDQASKHPSQLFKRQSWGQGNCNSQPTGPPPSTPGDSQLDPVVGHSETSSSSSNISGSRPSSSSLKVKPVETGDPR